MLRAALTGLFAISILSSSTRAQEARAQDQRCSFRRGNVEQVDHLAQMVKVRFDQSRDVRYFYIHQHARI